MTIGERIKYYRLQKGLTQKELATMIGVAEITIRQYESNKREPKKENVYKLMDALSLNIYQLLDDNIGDQTIKLEENVLQDSPMARAFMKENPNSHLANEFIRNKKLEILQITTDTEALIMNYNKLNSEGKNEAQKQIQNLTKISDYISK